MPKKITETSKPKAKATQTKSTPSAINSAKPQATEKSIKPQKTDKTTEVVKKPENKKASKRKILFVGSEAFPFAGTGGLGEVLGSLPRAVNDGGEIEARVILPL